jgi:hypothetical protein
MSSEYSIREFSFSIHQAVCLPPKPQETFSVELRLLSPVSAPLEFWLSASHPPLGLGPFSRSPGHLIGADLNLLTSNRSGIKTSRSKNYSGSSLSSYYLTFLLYRLLLAPTSSNLRNKNLSVTRRANVEA